MNHFTHYDLRLLIDDIAREFPDAAHYALDLIRSRKPVKMIEAIERITSEPGGATYSDMARRTGFSTPELRDRLVEMRRANQVHVVAWKREPGHIHLKPIYVFGPGESVPYPKVEKPKPAFKPGAEPAKRSRPRARPLAKSAARATVSVQRDPAAAWF